MSLIWTLIIASAATLVSSLYLDRSRREWFASFAMALCVGGLMIFAHPAHTGFSPILLAAQMMLLAMALVDLGSHILPLRLQLICFVIAASATASSGDIDLALKAEGLLYGFSICFGLAYLGLKIRGGWGIGFGDFLLLPALALVTPFSTPWHFAAGICFGPALAIVMSRVLMAFGALSEQSRKKVARSIYPAGPGIVAGAFALSLL